MATPQLSKVTKQTAKKNDKATEKITAKKEEALLLAVEALGVSAAQPKEPLGLLDLPAELWSKICKLAVERDYTVLMRFSLKHQVIVRQPAITKVCRGVREECLPHFYAANKFGYLEDLCPFSFQRRLPEHLARKFHGAFDKNFAGLVEWSIKTNVKAKPLAQKEVRSAMAAENRETYPREQASAMETVKAAAEGLQDEPERPTRMFIRYRAGRIEWHTATS